MDRVDLIEAHQTAAAALQAGIALAERSARLRRREPDSGLPDGRALGSLLADPGAFWASAAAHQIAGDGDSVSVLALENRLTAARAAVGDLEFVRASLIGQAQWLGVLAVGLADDAGHAKDPERKIALLKLALAAQRQAAQTIASVATLARF